MSKSTCAAARTCAESPQLNLSHTQTDPVEGMLLCTMTCGALLPLFPRGAYRQTPCAQSVQRYEGLATVDWLPNSSKYAV